MRTSQVRPGVPYPLGATFTELKVRRDPDCPICSIDPADISEEEMGQFPDYELFCAGAG